VRCKRSTARHLRRPQTPPHVSKKWNDVSKALPSRAIRRSPVMALVAELHGLRVKAGLDWRYNAFEVPF
jgi:hypothetical protein